MSGGSAQATGPSPSSVAKPVPKLPKEALLTNGPEIPPPPPGPKVWGLGDGGGTTGLKGVAGRGPGLSTRSGSDSRGSEGSLPVRIWPSVTFRMKVSGAEQKSLVP